MMVPDVEYLFRQKLLLEFPGPQVERLNTVIDDAGILCFIAVAPYGTELGFRIHVGPDHVAHDEHARRRAMAPSAVAVLPHLPAVLGIEGIKRARHRMVRVVRVRLRLGQ